MSAFSRIVTGFGTSIAGGALLGGAAWLSDQLSWPWSLLIPANAIGVWLAVAFVLGASARTVGTGALRGLIGMLSAVAAYYLLFALLGEGFRAVGAGHAASIWGVVALVAGPVMGWAGATWRHADGWRRSLAVALLAAALIAEGVAFGAERLVHIARDVAGLPDDPGALLFGAEIVIGLALPGLMLSRGERLRGYLATAGLAVAAAIAIGPVTAVIRGFADRF